MTTILCLVAAVVAIAAFRFWKRRNDPQTFTHEGGTYTRRPDGTFVNAAGGLVTTAALVAALGLAYQQRLERAPSSSDSDGEGGLSLGWGGGGGGTDSDSANDSGSDSGGGDSGGGDSGGGDSGGGDSGGGGD